MKNEMRGYILPLLPYNFEVLDSVSGKIFDSSEFISEPSPGFRDEEGFIEYPTNLEQLINDDLLKIILRPLDDLRKVIEFEGEKFIPFSRLTQNLQMQMDIFDLPQILDFKVIDYQRTLMWNFDLFGLIAMGKGVNINTLDDIRTLKKNNE